MTKQKHFYLIRGLIREHAHWGNFIDHLTKCFPGSLITTLDIPGAGIYYNSPSPASIKEMLEQMHRDYLKHCKENEEPILVAISLGGMIAVEWLGAHPRDFSYGILINTSFGDFSPVYQRLMPSAFKHLVKVFALKGREKESHILKLVTNNRDVFAETLDLWDDIQSKRPVSTANTLKQLMAGATFRVGNFTPPIKLQIIASTKDRMVNVECSRTIARKWKLPIVEHPTGGHDLTVDDPEWVALRIKDFDQQVLS